MNFQDTFDTTKTAIDALRGEMDSACREGLKAMTEALFAENGDIGSIYWTQSFDPAGAGFSLGSIYYTTVNVIAGEHAPQLLHLAATGPTPLAMYAGFLRSISYHLFCAHGPNATVTVTPAGVSVAKP